MSNPPPPNPPPLGYAVPNTVGGNEQVASIIPYRNWAALTSYYLGLFSLFPVLGFFLAVPALVLGIMGYRRYLADRQIKGNVHAIIGIVCGAIFTLIWGASVVLIIVGTALAKGS